METTLDVDDDIAQAAHQLIVQYGARAAEVARGHARIAEDDDEERAWLDIAEIIDREKVPGNGV
jgi:Trp operon repressor